MYVVFMSMEWSVRHIVFISMVRWLEGKKSNKIKSQHVAVVEKDQTWPLANLTTKYTLSFQWKNVRQLSVWEYAGMPV